MENIQGVARELFSLLSDTYVLYVKTQNFHWNVESLHFFHLHKMFQEQYEELAEAIDEIAERMRALKFLVPGSLKKFAQFSTLQEEEKILKPQDMLLQLLQDHTKIIVGLHQKIKDATGIGDEASADLFIERLRRHEKVAWMLRAATS